jgi:hypothetical protein
MPRQFFFIGLLLILGNSRINSNHSARNRYLSLNGADRGSCSAPAHPCRTFNYVDSIAASGDIVHVSPGTYTLTSSTCITTNTPGVTWQSDTRGSVTIDGRGHCQYLWHNSGNSGHVNLFGFQFTGVQVTSRLDSFGVLLEGSEGNFEVAYNTFHDFGTSDAKLNFGAALSVAPWKGGEYSGRSCKIHDNIFYNIAPGGSFTFNSYAIYAICGRAHADHDPWIFNNLIYNEGSIAISLWHAADHIHVYNNTIDRAYMGILAGSGDQGAVNHATFEIANNLITNSHYGISAEDADASAALSPLSSISHNLTSNNSNDWAYNKAGKKRSMFDSFLTTANISGDPGYVAPATGDYRLTSTSSAKGKGLQTPFTPNLDLAGRRRPNPPSIGAFEPQP